MPSSKWEPSPLTPYPSTLGTGFVTLWTGILGTLLPGGRVGLMSTWHLLTVFS